jgi:hypothetical protein
VVITQQVFKHFILIPTHSLFYFSYTQFLLVDVVSLRLPSRVVT